jgi:steroid delta-isomerase-like uncharacterized protein
VDHLSQRDGAKDLVARYFKEFWNTGNVDAATELLAPDFVTHRPHKTLGSGRDGFRAHVLEFRRAFPDLHEEIVDMIGEGDRVAALYTLTATHLGEYSGIPPTGRRVHLMGVDVLRIHESRIVELWCAEDDPVHSQLGGHSS